MVTILVVDDRAINREFLSMLLGYAGYRVIEAADGTNALTLIREVRPDLVISDIAMPTMDGIEFSRRLRADPEIAGTPIIFYTATYRMAEVPLAHGLTTVLAKPSRPQAILEAVATALGGAAAPAAPPPTLAGKPPASEQGLSLRLSTLLELGLDLAAERDSQHLLDLACRAAQEILEARASAVGIIDDDTGQLSRSAMRGLSEEATARLAADDPRTGLIGAVLSSGTPCRHPGTSAGLPPWHTPGHALLVVPVKSATRIYGWLYLGDPPGRDAFGEDDEQIALTLATQLALAYENLVLYGEACEHAAQLRTEVAERQRAWTELQESESRFRQLAENIREVFFLVDAMADRIIYVSPAYEEVWGRSCASRYAQPWSSADSVHADDRAQWSDNRRRALATGQFDDIYRIVRPNGAMRWVRARGFPIRAATGEVYRVAAVAEDITEVRKQQDRIARLNRVRSVLSGINSAIVRIHNPEVLFEEACRIAVKDGKFGLSWIGGIDRQSRTVAPTVWARSDEDGINVPWSGCNDLALARGIVGDAVKQSGPVYENDLNGGIEASAGEPAALPQEFRSVIVLPLMVENEPVAVLTLYAREAGFFTGEELEVLMEMANDISFALDSIRKQDRLVYLAHHDALTGLPNRPHLLEYADLALQGAREKGQKVGMVIFDISRFRNLNDTYGRAVGDALLCELAQRFSTAWLNPAQIARCATDHFAGILVDIQAIADIAHAVQKAALTLIGEPFPVAGEDIHLSLSAGIAVFPEDGQDAETLFRNAEAALRKAKGSGERYLFYRPEMNAMVADTLALEIRLQRAVSRNEFIVHYQPKVHLATRQITGFEALIRWNDPESWLVPPGRFIPLLEETGMILEVGAWVIRQAIADAHRLRRDGVHRPRIAVNVSPVQLQQREFVDTLRDALSACDGERPPIDLEITESIIMSDIEQNIGRLRTIRDLGLDIAIDDFGTGYSSLSYLARLPVNALKIDQSFIFTMMSSAESMSIVSMVIALAHSLSLNVIAEGVETAEQVAALDRLGCDELQGYVVSPAVTVEQAAAFLLSAQRGAQASERTDKLA